MLLGITIDSNDPAEVAVQMGYYLIGLVQSNRLIMRRESIPPLYRSGVRYRIEPWAAHLQSLSNCREAIERRWLECKAAAAWLCAEYREKAGNEELASQYDVDVTWKDALAEELGLQSYPAGSVVRVFHARVLHPSGRIEDPTHKLRRA